MFSTNQLVAPGAIIGYRRSGAPIRLIAGASGEGDEGGGTGQEGTGETGATGEDTGQEGDAGGTGGRTGTGTGQDDTPRVIAALRSDFKSERSKRQAAEQELAQVKAAQTKLQEALDADRSERQKQMDALAKAMGLKTDEDVEKASPAELDEAMRKGLLRDLGVGAPRARAWRRH